MADVTLSNAVRSNLLSLQKTADLLGKTQERLSTGLKVNSALDDPTAFFTASSLNSRAGDLNRLLDSVGNAVQTVEAANDGLSAITKLVETAQATARQALEKPTTTAATVSTTTGTITTADVAATRTGGASTIEADRNQVIEYDGGFGTGGTVGAGNGGTFDVNGVTVTVLDADDIDDVTDKINAAIDADGTVNITASNDGTNITLTADDADTTITVDAFVTTTAADLGFDSTGGAGTQAIRNLLTNQGTATIADGDTLAFKVGDLDTQTITFGTGTGEVSTKAELDAALANLTGFSSISASATGSISFTAAEADADVVVTRTGIDITDFGFAADANSTTFEPSNADIAAITASSTLTVKVGSNATTTVTFGTGTDVGNLRDLNAALAGLVGGTASVDASGNLSVVADNTTDSITIGGSTNPATFGVSAGITAPTQNADRAALETQFNNLRSQIDALAGDASFNGINLLNGDSLNVIFNENNTSSLSITGVTFNSAGLGISEAATDSFQSDTAINASLDELDTAIGQLRQQASTFGSNLSVVEIRQDFTKNLINTLETGAANLTLADTNEEGANTLALQTRQQLSSVALSLASQADQNVLRLF